MIKKTVYISQPYYLSVKLGQLQMSNKETGELSSLPLEDIGFIVLDCKQITYSHTLIQQFAKENIAAVFCDDNHHPASMLYHLDSNQVQTQSFGDQIKASEPLKKNLWKQVIIAKIKNQAALLKKYNKEYKILLNLSNDVKSGDTDNREAAAAKYYWKYLFDDIDFKRDRFGDAPNNLLNYTYAILRAAIARALAGSGLLPTVGIHHRNKYNSFCLADDIMEPYRPYADEIVYNYTLDTNNSSEITKEFKQKAFQLLVTDVKFTKVIRPLMIGISFTSSSLVKCFSGELKSINYPNFI